MKRYDEMTYDEQEAWINYAEAEFCSRCGGRGIIAVYVRAKDMPGFENVGGRMLERYDTCDACNGSGRA